MKKNYNIYIQSVIIATIVMISGISVATAQVNTLYYIETVPTRHEFNPSFQPSARGYFSTIPVLSGFYAGAGNNSLTLSDILLPSSSNGRTRSAWFYTDAGELDDFYSNLKKTTHVYSETDLRLFAFGIRILDSAWFTVGLNTKSTASVLIPKDLIRLFAYGTTDTASINRFNFDRFGVRANVYTELAFGYSQRLSPKLTVGGKLKFLIGHSNVTANVKDFKLDASRESWNFIIDGSVKTSIPSAKYEIDNGKLENINLGNMTAGDMISGGFGVAIDLGANYKLFDDRLTVSASLLDLGFISWKAKNSSQTSINGSFEFTGIDFTFEDGVAQWDEDYLKHLEESIEYKTRANSSYLSTLAAKVFLGAEYRVLDNKFSLGALSKSTIINKTVFEEITASFNYLEFEFFNASLSYSLLNGHFSTFGLGLGGRLGPVNLYLAGDYFTAKYSKQYIPYKNKAFNLQMGILFNFGWKNNK
jgi:hypothetical protein